MKLRIMGTEAECEMMKKIFWENGKKYIRNISDFYANRGYSNEGRIYIEIQPLLEEEIKTIENQFTKTVNQTEEDNLTLPCPEHR